MRRLPSRRECAAEAAARHVPVNRPSRGFPLLVVATIVLLCAPALPAQAIGQGFELERAGQYDQAAAIYLATLRAEPTNLSALLGLERVLPPLNRLGDLLPAAQRAAAASPSNVALRGVLLRTYVALNEPDSGRAVALRWAAAAPGDEAPYREWAMALEDAHRHGPARDVLLLGRRARRSRHGVSPTLQAPAARPTPGARAPSHSRATPTWRPRLEGRPPGRAPTRRALSSKQAIGSPRAPCSNGSRRTRMHLLTPNDWRSAPWSRP